MKLTRMHLEYVTTWPNHAGMFVARKKGWYADAGLDVDIIWDGWDRGTPVDLVIAGEYQFAAVRLGELLETRSTQHPFTALATFNQTQLGGIISLRSMDINRFADLEGKTVAIPPVGRLVQMVREAVTKDGGDPAKVNFVDPSPYEPDIRSIERGTYDALFNVLGWEAYQGSQPYENVVQLSFDTIGVAPHHAYFLCTTDDIIAREPQMVHDFVAATSAGYDFARDNPEETLDIISQTMCNCDEQILTASLRFMTPSWHAPTGRWGEMDESLIRSYTQWMVNGGFTTAVLSDVDGAWTNDFLPTVH